MATVYLPLGYPILGETFETVVYQGTMARLYTLAADPRTGDQTFSRKFLSDVSKMRASANAWAKGLWKVGLGTKWATIIYQMARADVDGLWTARVDEWDNFSNEIKAGLAGEAPYQVTYNDPGMIWWALYGMLYDWMLAHGLAWWGMPAPDEEQLGDMLDFWSAGLQEAVNYGGLVVGHDDPILHCGIADNWTRSGSWSEMTDALSTCGKYLLTSQDTAYLQQVFYLTNWRAIYRRMTDAALCQLYVDTIDAGYFDMNGSDLWGQVSNRAYLAPGSHTLKLQNAFNGGTKFYFEGVEYWIEYEDEAVTKVGSWSVVNSASASNGRYIETSVNGAQIDFVMVGRYAKVIYTGLTNGWKLKVFIDGVEQLEQIDQRTAVTEYLQEYIIGPLVMGIHHIVLEFWNGGNPSNKGTFDAVKIRRLKSAL